MVMSIPCTPKQLALCLNMTESLAAFWLPHVDAACASARIQSIEDVAIFIAQTGHESNLYTQLVENLNYSPEGLVAKFSAYRRNPDMARKHGRTADHPADQYAIGNFAYNGRLGNRPGTDDGFRYRGHGLIQVTGLRNHERCGAALKLSLILQPELLTEPRYAATSSAWFWNENKVLGADIVQSTRVITGPAMTGLDKRRALYTRVLSVLAN